MQAHIVRWMVKQPWWRIAAGCGVIAVGIYLFTAGTKPKDFGVTFVARRGPLDIVVLVGGSIESEEKGEIKCEVKGGQGVKIIKIVEEGYQVTAEDVKTNKVLVELDSADLRNKITQQEITFGSTAASLTDAQQAYEIQVNQNLSDIMTAAQKATFARMDFEKYLGDQAARDILGQLGISTEQMESVGPETNRLSQASLEPAPPSATNRVMAVPATYSPGAGDAGLGGSPAPVGPAPVPVDLAQSTNLPSASTNLGAVATLPNLTASVASAFSKYTNADLLADGEARQKLRDLQDAVQMARKETQQAQATLEGTRRLSAKGFATRVELDRDQIACDNSLLKIKKAETALNLFMKYELPKSAQEGQSKYIESLRELDRTRKGAVSKLAQADAKLKSAQAKYSLEQRQLKEFNEQLEKCSIKALRPGLVVYGSGGEVRYWRDEEQIREGASVREGQTLLTIPDMRKMCIKVKIHETYIKQIQKGQQVRITADAFPDRKLNGEVSQVGVLPDSENSWLNPDMKVYRTTVTIKGTNDWLRPGMSSKVQILVNQLSNVVHVPLQAVSPLQDTRVCYVVHRGRLEQRAVEIGDCNDEFIEIKKGIQEGDRVSLRTPSSAEEEQSGKGKPKAAANPEKSKSEGKGASTGAGSKP